MLLTCERVRFSVYPMKVPRCKVHNIPMVCYCPACRGEVSSERKAESSRRNGLLGGRHPILDEKQAREASRLYQKGATLVELAGRFNVSVSAMSRTLARRRERNPAGWESRGAAHRKQC